MTEQTGGAPQITIGKNPERSREHNRRVVLDAIRQHGALGRMHIARLTQLTPQAVANIVDELVGEGFLLQAGRLKAGRGQPPVQFVVNPDGGMTVGIEIATDRMTVAVLGLTGKLRHRRTVALADTSPEHLMPVYARELEAARAACPSRLLGVGVVMPGPFGIEGMSSVGPTTLPGWNGMDAAAALSQAGGVPAIVDNDANAAAVAERLFGAGHSISNFCMVYFGAGVGLGMIQDGAPYRGAFGNAGEIGHIVVSPGGRACPCGQRGCLERYASLHALREKLDAAGIVCEDVAALDALHRAGNVVVKEWITEAALHLSPMIAMLENILDPETVILGGALPDGMTEAIIAAMGDLPTSVASRRARALPRALAGRSGQYTAALGAAALPLLDVLTPRLETSPIAENAA